MKNKNILAFTSSFVIILTFILFTVALFTKGFTQDLLLEAGVFLVSVKLILMSYRMTIIMERVESRLNHITIGNDNVESRKS